ncbi:unnamed protein product [Musa acuminata subsp. malaccensis]|uniref:(wild Malaysian banana) hypothetical protein n=1 Tax=Musa acuminata subsp. malaccensis TaxID=214687 RepID=A0A804JFH3_MUSAM|nr:unnamed protein product [Musa acuminata subsp. malaccensis]
MLLDLLIRFSDPYVGTFGVDLSDEESERRLRSGRSLRSSRKREFSFELDLIVGREEDSCHGFLGWWCCAGSWSWEDNLLSAKLFDALPSFIRMCPRCCKELDF